MKKVRCNEKLIISRVNLINDIHSLDILKRLNRNMNMIVIANICEFRNLGYLKRFLTNKEKNKLEKFVFEDDRKRYILSHGLLNYIFSDALGISIKNIKFYLGDKGKPKIKNKYKINYNISHSKELILIGFSKEKEIGIDVEKVYYNIDYKEISEAFFHPYDLLCYSNKSKIDEIKSFFKIWVVKEAYTKALGTGLSRSLDTFFIKKSLNNKLMVMDIINSTETYIKTFKPQLGYIAAISILDKSK
ncbi:4'-phosphopantetheinyl transferase family protein [Clostridium oceanicum]|uniref:4'-phosphopantetheinyl transferase superfamily protein n=1 Tax=Clostridium oceanicum TaxID=1543 RepID=A0ABN1JDK9_9CLOT